MLLCIVLWLCCCWLIAIVNVIYWLVGRLDDQYVGGSVWLVGFVRCCMSLFVCLWLVVVVDCRWLLLISLLIDFCSCCCCCFGCVVR